MIRLTGGNPSAKRRRLISGAHMRSSTPRSNAHRRPALTGYGRNIGGGNCFWIWGVLADKKVDGEICNETSGTPCFSCNNLAPNAHGCAAIMVSLSASASKRSNKGRILTTMGYHNVFSEVRGFHSAGLLIAA